MKQNYNKFASMIMEEVSIRDYTQEDFVDVYITVFKNWIKENYGESELKYPFSYLKNKYEDKFYKTYNLEKERWAGEYSAMSKAGKKFVEMSLHAYEDVPATDSSWFDKPLNQKLWKSVENQFKFPSYMKVDVVETRPRNLELRVNVDFVDFIKSPEKNPYPTSWRLQNEIQKFMQKYGGVKFGNPLHGDLNLSEGYYNFEGHEDWLNKTLKKEIKPKLKKEVDDPSFRGLKYEMKSGEPTLKILYSSRNWSARDEIQRKVEKFFRDMGYSNNLRISRY